jgi:hypothetical protein
MKTDSTTTTAPVLDPLQRCTDAIRQANETARAVYTGICKERQAFEKAGFTSSPTAAVATECRSIVEYQAKRAELRSRETGFDLAAFVSDALDRAPESKPMLLAALNFVKGKAEDAKKAKSSLLAKIAAAVTSSTSTEEALPPTRPVMSGPFGNAPMDLDAELDLASKAISTFPWDTGYAEIVSKLNRIASELHLAEPKPTMPARMDRPFIPRDPPPSSRQPVNGYTQPPVPVPQTDKTATTRPARVIVNA